MDAKGKAKRTGLTREERWQRGRRAAQLRASGLTIEQIATELNASPTVVRNDLQQFYRQLLDFMMMGGTVIGELLHQLDNIMLLALTGYTRATVTRFDRSGRTVEEPDHSARRGYLSVALEAIKEKAEILGLKEGDNSLVLQLVQNAQGNVTMGATVTNRMRINADKIPEIREHLRAMKQILYHTDDAETAVRALPYKNRIKDPPTLSELPGVILDLNNKDMPNKKGGEDGEDGATGG